MIECRASDAQNAYEAVFLQVQACLAELQRAEQRVADIEAEIEELLAKCGRHKALRDERTALYDSVFTAQSSGYPEEDAAKDAVLLAKLAVDVVSSLCV